MPKEQLPLGEAIKVSAKRSRFWLVVFVLMAGAGFSAAMYLSTYAKQTDLDALRLTLVPMQTTISGYAVTTAEIKTTVGDLRDSLRQSRMEFKTAVGDLRDDMRQINLQLVDIARTVGAPRRAPRKGP